MFALAVVLAQTTTAVTTTTTTSFDEVKSQLEQALVAAVGALLIALIAALKQWIKARLAAKLTGVAIEGVERSTEAVTQALKSHLSPATMAKLATLGVNVDDLRNDIVDATKASIKSVSIAAGTEPAMAVEVAKVTTQPEIVADVKRSTSSRLTAVDAEGNPVK